MPVLKEMSLVQEQAELLAVLGQVADAMLDGTEALLIDTFLCRDADAGVGIRPEQSARATSSTGTNQSAKPKIFGLFTRRRRRGQP